MVFSCSSPLIVMFFVKIMFCSLYVPLAIFTVPSEITIAVAFFMVFLGPTAPVTYIGLVPSHESFPDVPLTYSSEGVAAEITLILNEKINAKVMIIQSNRFLRSFNFTTPHIV